MKFGPIQFTDRRGREVRLRSAEPEDAAWLIEYLRVTAGETRYLVREPEEVTLTPEQERSFLQEKLASPRELMLVSIVEGVHAGNCSLMAAGSYGRYAHRCQVAIALYQRYCGAGIGRQMLETVLTVAGQLGYEQAELEVAEENGSAVSLYASLGFQVYGKLPRSMKYADGTYADALWMAKML